jgi:ligand-binding SRPBCC domain-containing protein
MTRIETSILIAAPIEAVFDAERNISLHAATQKHRGERAVGGVTEGLIGLGEEVEWEAVHFGIRQRLRVRITRMNRPRSFRDEMISGAFKTMTHEHLFREAGPALVEKTDIMTFEAPLGVLGLAAELIFLRCHMKRFLERKNRELKRIVENGGRVS